RPKSASPTTDAHDPKSTTPLTPQRYELTSGRLQALRVMWTPNELATWPRSGSRGTSPTRGPLSLYTRTPRTLIAISTSRHARSTVVRSIYLPLATEISTRTGLAFTAANSDHTNTTTTWPRKKKPANGNRPADTANTRHGHSDHQRSDRRQLIGPTTGETMALTKSQLEEINQALQLRIAHLEKQNQQLRAANEQLIARTEALTKQTETLAAQLR